MSHASRGLGVVVGALALWALSAAGCDEGAAGGVAADGAVRCGAGRSLLELAAPDGLSVERWCVDGAKAADGPYARLGLPAENLLVSGGFAQDRAEGSWTARYPDGALRYEHGYRAGLACGDWRDLTPAGEETRHRYAPCDPKEDPAAAFRAPSTADFGFDGVTCPGGGAVVSGGPHDPNARFCVQGQTRSGPYGRWADPALSQKIADGSYAGGLRDGPERTWTQGGVLASSGAWKAGERVGSWKRYDPDGWLVSEGGYAAGLKTGTWIERYPGGTLRAERGYAAGLQDGAEHTFFADGAPETDLMWAQGQRQGPMTRYRPGGGMAETGAYAGDLRQGRWTVWAENGETVEEGDYALGRRTGVWKDFSPDGTPLSEGPYVDGVRSGTWRLWQKIGGGLVEEVGAIAFGLPEGTWVGTWEGGAPYDQRVYVDGLQQGDYQAFWPSGQQYAEGSYLDGVQFFHWRYWYPSGQLQAEGDYQDGAPVPGTWQYFREDGSPAGKEVLF